MGDPGEGDFEVGGLVCPGLSICLAEVLKVYLLGPGRGGGRRRVACDGNLCFYGCEGGKKLVFLGMALTPLGAGLSLMGLDSWCKVGV